MSDNSHQCSPIFSEVFDSHCAGPVRDCVCGITHFDTCNNYDWEDGELEGLIEKAETQPDKYRASDGAVGTIEINGIEIVWGCTCDKAKKYETFLIEEGPRIIEYLRRRAAALRDKADSIDPDLGSSKTATTPTKRKLIL